MAFGSVFENRIDLEIIEICFIYQTPIMFKAARTQTLLKAGTTLSALINFKLFVGPGLGPNFLLMLSAEAR